MAKKVLLVDRKNFQPHFMCIASFNWNDFLKLNSAFSDSDAFSQKINSQKIFAHFLQIFDIKFFGLFRNSLFST